MTLALLPTQLEEVHELETKLNCCKRKDVQYWIDDIHFETKKSRSPGIPIKNSCNKMYCPRCMKRVVFNERWKMFERFEDKGHVYHFTFSPEFEFFFYSDYPGKKVASIVRSCLMGSIKKFVENRGGDLIGFFGWHYIGDKDDEFQTRLHAHILFSTDVEVFVHSVEEKKKEKKETGLELYSADELEIIEDFKDRLKRTKFFNWAARYADRVNKGKKSPDFVYFYNVDYKKEKTDNGRVGSRDGLYKAVGYLCKYLLFKDDGSILEDNRREFLMYYVNFKQNFISPFGLIAKKISKLRERDSLPAFINGVTGFKMVCVSKWVLNVEMKITIILIWNFDFGYKLSKVELEWLDKVKKRAGYD